MNAPISMPSIAADSPLARAAEEFMARMTSAEWPDIESLLAEFPEQQIELRRLLPAMLMLVAFGKTTATDAPRTATIGQELGDFRILHEIGRGGMGIVYEAEQLSLGRRVALKVLPFAGVLDERQLLRFKHEASAAAMLKHPHIVSVYSIGCERGVHFYAMELIDGQTLAQLMETRRQAPGVSRQEPIADTPVIPERFCR